MYAIRSYYGRKVMKGHCGFNGHSDPVRFRNILIKKIADADSR